MLALIDGDIVRYRTGFASNDVNEAIACARANETIEQILGATNATEFRVYLSDSTQNNFRTKLYPAYKASREGQPKPVHHAALGDFLKSEWGAIVTEGQEADDALGIDQTTEWEKEWHTFEPFTRTILCSIDKDLLQVPGLHYNWVRNEFIEQNYYEGLRRFYLQCLTGDRTDDVYGIHGIGPKKAELAIQSCQSEAEIFNVVRNMWNDDERLLLTGRLLWVRRHEGELWQFPTCTTQDTTAQLLFSNTTPEESDLSLVLGTPETIGHQPVGSPEVDTTKKSSEL